MSQHSLPGSEDITRAELSNGIVVLTRPNFFSQSVAIKGYVRAGSLYDPIEKLGLGEFTTALMARGTTDRSFDEIFEAQESVGARLGLSSGTHLSAINGYCLAEDLRDQLELLADLLRNPLFDADEMEKLRKQFLTGLDLRAQSTSAVAELNFDAMLYGDHPYGRPDEGYIETISNITREDISNYHKTTYGPRGMAICFVGAIKPEQALEWAEDALGDWLNKDQREVITVEQAKPLTAPARKHIVLTGKTQTDLLMGVLSMKRKDPDFMPAMLANSILGQFGMMGRIGEEVREKSGLAYYASSGLSASSAQGSWDISAGVNPKNLNKAIELIHKVIADMIKEGVTEEELVDNQDAFIGRLPLSMESNLGVARAVLDLERKKLDFDYYYKYADMIRAITREQVNEAARKYLGTENYVISTCGPKLKEEG